jgi:hypothetical protein
MQATLPVLSRAFGKSQIKSRSLAGKIPQSIYINWFVAGFRTREGEDGSLFLTILITITFFRRCHQLARIGQDMTNMAQ